MYISSQLRKAALENLASDPVTGVATGRMYFNTTTGKFRVYNGTAWEDVGSGSSGGVNYINNSGFEASTDGWETYADAAGVQPVNGTGGAATTTLTRVTSTPLRGSAMGRITKDAANRQGEGVSYDFTITAGDKSKLMRIEFTYDASANFDYGDALNGADPSDVTVWVYDKDGSVLYSPSPNRLDGGGRFVGFFQTTTNDDYRLILHIATTNANAWTLDIDDVSFSPSEAVYGPAMTDWTSFTATGAWSSNTTYTSFYRRVGDSAEIRYLIATSGAPTSASLTLDLPTGLTIDAAKMAMQSPNTETGTVGYFTIDDASTNLYQGSVIYNTSTSLQLRYSAVSGGNVVINSPVTQAAPHTFGAGDSVTVYALVPIAGWGSNVQVSNGDGRAAIVSVYGQPNSSINGASRTLVTWGSATELVDNMSAFDPTTGLLTAKVAGYYKVTGQVAVSGTEVNDTYVLVQLKKNGSDYGAEALERVMNTSLSSTTCAFAFPSLFLNPGDTLGIGVMSGITTPTWSVDTTQTFLSIDHVPIAGTISAGDKVAVYATNSTTSYGTTDTDVVFGTESIDTHGAWSGTEFTAPIAAYYDVEAFLYRSASVQASAGQTDLYLFKNGSNSRKVGHATFESAATVVSAMSCSTTIFLNPGDVIKLVATRTATVGAVALAGGVDTWISINKQT